MTSCRSKVLNSHMVLAQAYIHMALQHYLGVKVFETAIISKKPNATINLILATAGGNEQ